jgi:hypothetical protein
MKTSAALITVLLFSVFSCEPFYLCPNGDCDYSYHPKDRDFNADLVLAQSPNIIPYEVKTSDQLSLFIPKQFDVTGASSYTGNLIGLNWARLEEPRYNDECRCARGNFSLLLTGSSILKLNGGYTLYAKPNATHVFWVNSFARDNNSELRFASITLEGPFDGKVYRLRGKGHINY